MTKDKKLTSNLLEGEGEGSNSKLRFKRGLDTEQSSGEKSKYNRLPTLTKYGSKKNILVNLPNEDGNHTKSMRNLSQAKRGQQLHIPIQSLDQFGNPREHQYLTTRQSQSNNAKMHSRSQQLLPLHKNSSQYFDPMNYQNGRSTVQKIPDGSILTLNKLPEIVNHSQIHQEPSHLLRTSSRNENSLDRPGALSHNPLGDNLSVYKKQPTPRQQHYGPLPISLPKMSDFWRGRMPEPIAYGDSINYKTSSNTKSKTIPPSATPPSLPIQSAEMLNNNLTAN